MDHLIGRGNAFGVGVERLLHNNQFRHGLIGIDIASFQFERKNFAVLVHFAIFAREHIRFTAIECWGKIDSSCTRKSLFISKIKNRQTVVNIDEGLIVSKTIQKVPLPKQISYIKIITKPKTVIKWSSPYKEFKILISQDPSFSNPPLYNFYTVNKAISPDLDDGKWYINIKAKHNDLYSLPVIKKFISLNNYYQALQYYKNNNIQKALEYIKKSVATVNKASPLPYYLYAKILFKLKKYKKALKYIGEGEKVGQKEKAKAFKAKIFYIKGDYKKVIEILKNPAGEKEKLLVAKAYYKLGQYKNANKYLYQILEKNPHNKEAEKFLTFPKELKKQGISNAFN